MSTVFSFFLLCSTFFFCISLLSLKVSLAHILGNQTDRLALLAFKFQITSDPFGVMSSWNDSNHFCDWEGVHCSHRHQRVRSLDLRSSNLAGSISPHLGNLSFLRAIFLQNNSFGGEVPHQLGQLFRLEDLYLNNNSLVGNIPGSISLCSNLITLRLYYNNLVGSIPMELGSLSKLGELDLGDNMLTGEIPGSISLCSNLIRLWLSNNNLVGSIPMELGSLSKLRELYLQQNMLTGKIPASLGNLTHLVVLRLAFNRLGGTIPNTLGQLKSLTSLLLGPNTLSGTIPLSIFNISTLEVFTLILNHLSGNILSEIGPNLPNLSYFAIGGNQFSGTIPASISNATRLQIVDIGRNQFTGKVPYTLGNLKDLEYLSLQKNDLGSGKVGDLDFIDHLANCSKLRVLGVAVNKFGGMLPASIGNFSKQLESLYLGYNKIFGNIPNEIGNLQNLFRLSLPGNSLTGTIPTSFKKLEKLQLLQLSSNKLSGHLPSFVSNMSQLYALHLSGNTLEGSISPALGNQSLQELYLDNNKFTGTIPKNIGLASRLLNLTLSNNSLNGSIPSEVDGLENIIYFDVSENKLSGEIPSALGSCTRLQHLLLGSNSFQGFLPSSLISMKDLNELDVSQNNFSGEIPKELEKLSSLTYLNLSFNNFEGEIPTEGIFRNVSAFSVFGNPKICGGIPKLGLPKCHVQTSKKKRAHFTLKVTLSVLIPSLIVVIFGLVLIVCFRKETKQKIIFEKSLQNLKWVSYNDLHKATDGFSSANLIGTGNSGSVYKGLLTEDEGHIAVKVFNLMEPGVSKAFMAECKVLRQVRHRNLLKILTVCSSVDFNGNDFKALVFDFMPNGSLESWLYPHLNGQYTPRTLNVYERLNISIDIAYALDYLHNHWDIPIVHCDLKASNVLLGDDLTAYVSDFGFAKFLAKNKNSNTSKKDESSTIAVRGTIGYIPPKYGMGAKVSTEGDIYSYGILLLEMFTGKRPTDHMFKDGLTLHDFSKSALPQLVMDITDSHMFSEELRSTETSCSIDQIKEFLSSVIKIGVACSLDLATDRMNIKDVLKEMQAIRETCIQYKSRE